MQGHDGDLRYEHDTSSGADAMAAAGGAAATALAAPLAAAAVPAQEQAVNEHRDIGRELSSAPIDMMFAGIGVWLGFIVLDGATYLLLALTLAVGLPLIHANAVKNATLVPTTVIAMIVFALKGNVDWTLGAIMGIGSVAGGILGARLATSTQARRWIFLLLVFVISAELVHLVLHYVFKTH